MVQSDSMELAKVIERNRHLTTLEQADRILDDLGVRRQYDIRDVYERDGMSLTTTKQRPHGRWVSDWVEIT